MGEINLRIYFPYILYIINFFKNKVPSIDGAIRLVKKQNENISFKKDDLKKLYDISDIVLEGNSSFANAAIQSDLAIIDAKSGASTEVPYLNPNVKILYLSTRKNC